MLFQLCYDDPCDPSDLCDLVAALAQYGTIETPPPIDPDPQPFDVADPDVPF